MVESILMVDIIGNSVTTKASPLHECCEERTRLLEWERVDRRLPGGTE